MGVYKYIGLQGKIRWLQCPVTVDGFVISALPKGLLWRRSECGSMKGMLIDSPLRQGGVIDE